MGFKTWYPGAEEGYIAKCQCVPAPPLCRTCSIVQMGSGHARWASAPMPQSHEIRKCGAGYVQKEAVSFCTVTAPLRAVCLQVNIQV